MRFKMIKNFKITKKKIIIFSIIVITLLIIFIGTKSFGMQNYYKLDFSTGLVTATTLNVRSGPGTAYPVVATVNKNQYPTYIAEEKDYMSVFSQVLEIGI